MLRACWSWAVLRNTIVVLGPQHVVNNVVTGFAVRRMVADTDLQNNLEQVCDEKKDCFHREED